MIHLVGMVHSFILQKMDKEGFTSESKEVFKSILEEYEVHINLIEQELKHCKKDHKELQTEIAQLVEENKQLYQRLKSLSERELQSEEKSTFNVNTELVDNLKQQLELALQENETVTGLWKSGLQEADSLRDQLQSCRSGKQELFLQDKLKEMQKDYSEVIQIFEARLVNEKKDNEQWNAKAEVLESQLSLLTEKSVKLGTSLNQAIAEQHEWKSRYLSLEAKYIELDRCYQTDKVKFARIYEFERVESQLKEKVETVVRQRDELQTALERCHERLAEQHRLAASHRERLEEAVALMEETTAREVQLTGEIKRLNTLREEGGVLLAQETASLKQQSENQLFELQHQLDIVKQERDRQRTEARQWQTECERLQTLLGKEKESVTRTIGQAKCLDSVYQDLHFTETECVQLHKENEALRSFIDRLQDRCRKHGIEKVKLKNEFVRLKEEKQLCQHKLACTAEKADMLYNELHEANLELTRLTSMNLFHQENETNLQTKVSVASTVELCRKLDDSYNKMNDKWKQEMHSLTKNFEAKLKLLKAKKKAEKQTGIQDNTIQSKENTQ